MGGDGHSGAVHVEPDLAGGRVEDTGEVGPLAGVRHGDGAGGSGPGRRGGVLLRHGEGGFAVGIDLQREPGHLAARPGDDRVGLSGLLGLQPRRDGEGLVRRQRHRDGEVVVHPVEPQRTATGPAAPDALVVASRSGVDAVVVSGLRPAFQILSGRGVLRLAPLEVVVGDFALERVDRRRLLVPRGHAPRFGGWLRHRVRERRHCRQCGDERGDGHEPGRTTTAAASSYRDFDAHGLLLLIAGSAPGSGKRAEPTCVDAGGLNSPPELAIMMTLTMSLHKVFTENTDRTTVVTVTQKPGGSV